MAKTNTTTSNKNTPRKDEYKIGSIVLGHYEIKRIIARGGMNSVLYLANDINIKSDEYRDIKRKEVTIKIIKKTKEITETEWTKFGDETETLGRLTKKNSKYTAEIYDRGFLDQDTLFIVMEYIHGETLAHVIKKQGHLSVDESLYITLKILELLKELQQSFAQKIIHRDLKPENIVLSNDWTSVKIIDFGIATSFENEKSSGTNDDEIFGTFPYITPQILELRGVKDTKKRKEIIKKIGVQFDFFALGIILYEMLMGGKPYVYKDGDEDKINALYYPINYDILMISELNDIPVNVENIILRLIASKNIKTNGKLLVSQNAKERDVPKDFKTLPYTNVNEIISDVNHAKDILHAPNKDLIKPKLLKPLSERRFQKDSNMFTIVDESEKFFDKTWVYCVIAGVIIVIVTLIIIFFHIF